MESVLARLTSALDSHNIPALDVRLGRLFICFLFLSPFPLHSSICPRPELFTFWSEVTHRSAWSEIPNENGASTIQAENDIQFGSIFHPHRIPDDVSSTAKNLNPSPPKLYLSVRSHASHSRRIPLLTIARIAPRIVKTETLPDHCLHYSFLCYYFR